MTDLGVAYFLTRVALGVNIFLHGFMRIATGLSNFVTTQAEAFAPPNSPLPEWSVQAFLYGLPFVETVLGALTALGLYTRIALVGGMVMILSLIVGHDLRQNWSGSGNGMHYVLYYALLIAGLRYNCLALDTRKAAVAA